MNDRDPQALLEASSGYSAGGIIGFAIAVLVLGFAAGAVARRTGRRGSVPVALALFAVSIPAGVVAVACVSELMASFAAGRRLHLGRRSQAQ